MATITIMSRPSQLLANRLTTLSSEFHTLAHDHRLAGGSHSSQLAVEFARAAGHLEVIRGLIEDDEASHRYAALWIRTATAYLKQIRKLRR